jgi:hypothetical protein
MQDDFPRFSSVHSSIHSAAMERQVFQAFCAGRLENNPSAGAAPLLYTIPPENKRGLRSISAKKSPAGLNPTRLFSPLR